ncbi:MAG: ATP-binding protein [Clostridiales bacterium]|nr:ATP-binding protein [Clostridiales bacterium]MDY4111804.1 ATP-binding protein [Roseburia sp.]
MLIPKMEAKTTMMQQSDKCVGIVDSVSASEVKGYLLDSAPQNVALSLGGLSLFPRINGFLMIPNETGNLVGMVNWIGFNHMATSNDVNLPKGSRMISMSILGHIEHRLNGVAFVRGSFSLPTVGDQILLPSEIELEAIIKNTQEDSIVIGKSPLTGNQPVRLPINELFGRHVAVLGNTGSGKSCTVAGLIRWSIEASIAKNGASPNARIIVLDPNGEYGSAFDGLDVDILKCSVKSFNANTNQLRVPAWMWNSSEWSSVFQASDKTQKPLLREALRILRGAQMSTGSSNNPEERLAQILRYIDHFLRVAINKQSYLSKEEKGNFGKELEERVKSLKTQFESIASEVTYKEEIEKLLSDSDTLLQKNKKSFSKNGMLIEYYDFFNDGDVQQLHELVKKCIANMRQYDDLSVVSEDDPVEFHVADLAPFIEDLAKNTVAAQYIDFMTVRIKSMLRNTILAPVIGNTPDISLLEWIEGYLGTTKEDGSVRGKICIIDFSLLPSEIVHLLVATIARLIFEALQRYRKFYGKEIPTLLVMEEAHSFIHKYGDVEDNSSGKLCTQVFEKIAREGRKFGLGLLISSQRPSELSSTVLSQCNSFILHRIVNDRDQEMVRRMVPDNLGNILGELPALPTKKAIVLGSAITVPTIVDINELPHKMRPKSETPDFWKVWNGQEKRAAEWTPVIDDWQKKTPMVEND